MDWVFRRKSRKAQWRGRAQSCVVEFFDEDNDVVFHLERYWAGELIAQTRWRLSFRFIHYEAGIRAKENTATDHSSYDDAIESIRYMIDRHESGVYVLLKWGGDGRANLKDGITEKLNVKHSSD